MDSIQVLSATQAGYLIDQNYILACRRGKKDYLVLCKVENQYFCLTQKSTWFGLKFQTYLNLIHCRETMILGLEQYFKISNYPFIVTIKSATSKTLTIKPEYFLMHDIIKLLAEEDG